MMHTNIAGVKVVVNPLAITVEPNRRHKHRRNQSAAYHARIQKKWVKRFGTKHVPGAYKINGAALGVGFGEVLVVHPVVYENLCRAF